MKLFYKSLLFILFLGLCFSTLAQDFWEEVFTSGPTIFSMDISDDGVIYLGTANGIWKSFDNGDSWEFDTISGNNVVIYSITANNEGIIYAGGSYRLYCSYDYGNSWTNIFTINNSNVNSVYSNWQGLILCGTSAGIYKSSNYGIDWDKTWEPTDVVIITSIIYKNETLYFSTYPLFGGGGVFKSLDNGNTWEYNGLSDHYISNLSFNSSGDIFATTRGHYNWYYGGVYKMQYIGNEWEEIYSNQLVTSITINNEDNIYISCSNLDLFNGGVRYTEDNGINWWNLNNGLHIDPNNEEIAIAPNNSYLFTVTKSPNKLYRSLEPTITDLVGSVYDKELVVYPNPFINEFFIRINGFESVLGLNILIINSKGEKILYLNDNRLNFAQEVRINSARFPQGVYYILFKINNNLISLKKIVCMS